MNTLPKRTAIMVFLAFAFAYFFSALLRAITATLSPTLTEEFVLNAGDLGLLAGAYFFGFGATQLPLGSWLDRYGPKQVILYFLAVAVLGCASFALATSFVGLFLARLLCGVGVSACLMAPLTGYRRWFEPATLVRANSWMLMTGSLGMVASTLPVQWLLPVVGWRVLFWGLTVLVLLSMALIAWQVPRWRLIPSGQGDTVQAAPSYAQVWKHPYFRKLAPIGFFCYGGLIAMQTLWVIPWMIKVAGYSSLQAASALFWLNVAMLCTFWVWGLANPWMIRRGLHADRLMALGLPFSFLFLAIIILAGTALSTWTGVFWTLYCVACTFVALTQPAIAMAFPPTLAGRGLSAFNLVIFAGIFVVQWGIGLAVDGFKALGLAEVQAFQLAMAVFWLCSVASYVFFLLTRSHNRPV